MPRDDHPAHAADQVIGHRSQTLGGDRIPAFEFAAKVRDRLNARGQAGSPEVEGGFFERGQRGEGRGRFVDGHRPAEFAARLAFVEPAQGPHRLAARSEPGCERAGDREIFERVLAQRRARREVVEAFERPRAQRRF